MTRIPAYSILKRPQARGAVVHQCGSCRGRRNDRVNDVAKWNGAWERKSFIYRFLHPDEMSDAGDVMEIKEI
eukprot:2235782-Ditylum_brightwellii.AAC.1